MSVCVYRLVVISGMQYYAQKTVKPNPQNGREDDVGALGTHDDVTPESRPLSHHMYFLILFSSSRSKATTTAAPAPSS